MKQKVKLWDIARKRIKVDVRQLSYNQFVKELEKKFGKKSGITSYFKNKNLFDWIKKSLVLQKSKKGVKYFRLRPTKWQKEEIKLLRKLSKKFKGKKLVEEFNKAVMIQRSYSSIITKLSRIKKRKK